MVRGWLRAEDTGDDPGMQLSEVIRAGHSYHHPIGFAIDRPQGSGDWVLIILLSPARMTDRLGERIFLAGTVFLFSPTFPQRIRDAGVPFGNHWAHLTGCESLVERFALPVDEAWMPASVQPLAPMFQAMERELRRREPGFEVAAGGQAAHLLALLARARIGGDEPLMAVRERIMHDLQRSWTVASMARLAGLSPSHFSARWRERFGTSPLQDLIAARVEKAGWLLAEGCRVAEAAEATGFRDPRYFSRVYRSLTGQAPSRSKAGPG